MRGLFLRHYLAQVCKDALPDTGPKYEGDGGMRSCGRLYTKELRQTTTWVRMQNQGPASRKKERKNANN